MAAPPPQPVQQQQQAAVVGESELPPDMLSGAEHLGSELMHQEQWLQLSRIRYRAEDGRELPWDCCERTTRVPGADCDGVEIIARLCQYEPTKEELREQGESLKDEPWYVLVRQYRPPVRTYVLEFPAGLLDGVPVAADAQARHEGIAECALRELREETGYSGQLEPLAPHDGPAFISHLSAPEPGLSNALGRLVPVYVDCRLPHNRTANLRQDLDDNESIQVLRVRQSMLFEVIQKHAGRGDIVDCKLYTFAMGLQFASRL